MQTGINWERAPDAALRLRAFAELRPKRRFKDDQPTSMDEVGELELPASAASTPTRRHRIRRSGRAQMRWRVGAEILPARSREPGVESNSRKEDISRSSKSLLGALIAEIWGLVSSGTKSS